MKFLGAPYPITKDPRGFLRTQGGVEQIKSDMLSLLLTYPGERVMLSTFGTPLRDLLFEPNDFQIITRAKQMIADAIRMWEPRVVIQQIDVHAGSYSLNEFDDGTEKDHILGISILFFDPENIKEVQQLKLELPLNAS